MNELEKKRKTLEAERDAIFDEIAPKQERLTAIADELGAIRKELSHAWLKEMGDTPDWPAVIKELADGPRDSVKLRYYVQEHLAKAFGMSASGYWSATKEAVIQLVLTKDDPESLRKNIAGVRYFSSILTPHPDGYIHFGVFEHNLSAGGSFTFMVKALRNGDKPNFILEKGSWAREQFDDLETAVRYIQDNHWYDKKEDLDVP